MTHLVLLFAIFGSVLCIAQPGLAISPDIRISQVYAGGFSGRVWNQDFVELFNASGASVSLDGWVLARGSSGAAGLDVVFAMPPGAVVPPCSYYLIALGPVQGSGFAFAADATCAMPLCALSSPSGQVGIKFVNAVSGEPCTLPTWHDVVGYGAASCFEGDGAAPGTAGAVSIVRIGNGMVDSDQNWIDFHASGAVPRGHLFPPDDECLVVPTVVPSWGSLKSIYR